MSQLVSIIIPTFNRAHLIGETLRSIINQTYNKWECIVVDDGSHDNTKDIIYRFIQSDDRIKYFERPADRLKGANACRNFGFEKSKGYFINWFDSDDVMMPNKLEVQVKALEQSLESPYCICQTQWIDKKTNTFLGLRSKSISSQNRFEDYLLYQIFWSVLAPLWRREFIESEHLKFDEALQQSQEYDYHLRALLANSKYIVIDTPLATMFKHENSISNNIYADNQKIESNIAVKEKIVDDYFTFLSHSGQINFLEILTLLFKDLLLERKIVYAKSTMRLILNASQKLNISKYKKAIFCFRLNLALYSYRIFGKGYSLVKPLSI